MLAWGLVAWLGGAGACLPRKAGACATVQALVLEELRVTDGFREEPHDGDGLARSARKLSELSARLRAMPIRDAELRRAVYRYGTDLEVLARSYARVAEERARPDTDAPASTRGDGGTWAADLDDGRVRPGIPSSTHEGAVNEARSAISHLCSDS